jgi:hypothetical protein
MVDFTHVNAALTRTGNDPISSFADGTVRAIVAESNYEVLVKAELANRWKFAGKFEALNLLVDEPPDPWLYAYQLPVDIMAIRTVTQAGANVEYWVESDVIYTKVDNSSEEILLHYVWRVPEIQWPPWFAEPMTQRLEAIFLRALGERHDEALARDKSADKLFADARRLDTQSQSPRNPWRRPIMAARNG